MSAAGFAGLAGALFAFSKGSISPDALGIEQVGRWFGHGHARWCAHAGWGPLVGAVTLTALQDSVDARSTDYWRAVLGGMHVAVGVGVSAGYCRVGTVAVATYAHATYAR